jgi:hypothetical protein
MDVHRGIARALAALIFLGSLVMWVGLPLGWIWLVGKLARRYPSIYPGALFGCLATMVVFALILGRLNAIHVRISGRYPGRDSTAWLKSLSGDRVVRGQRTVLDTSMVVSVVIAMVALTLWFFFFAHSYTPGLPAP